MNLVKRLGRIILALCWGALPGKADLLPFPLKANQHGLVYCLENPTIHYDVLLPAGYSTNGPPLPILYTFSPVGGGMVNDLGLQCSQLKVICIGITGMQVGVSWDVLMRECAMVSRDIRRRVLFDPTAEFAAGFSAGGESSYVFSRLRAQHVSGIFTMAGWLGRGAGYPDYQTTDRVLTNLLVARARGDSDGGGWVMTPDSNYLASFSASFHDVFFSGGHELPPANVKSNCLAWLISQRVPAAPGDQTNAVAQADDWRTRIAGGDREIVLRECVRALLDHPRSWMALEAQLVLDDLMLADDEFLKLDVSNLAEGDIAADLFYYLARGAGDSGDWRRYRAALKALTGVTGVSGDRAGDIYDLLQKYGHPAATLQCAVGVNPDQLDIWVSKVSPGLACSLEVCSDLTTLSWKPPLMAVLDANTGWLAQTNAPSESGMQFYRAQTTPMPGTSPPWPP